MQHNDIAIKVDNVSKTYKLYDKPIDRLKEALHLSKKEYHKEFYALHDISFEINKGETVGIIGTNGSGKSTLLKILTGVLNATSGTTFVDGKISALLELGAGFNSEYTGLENIYLNGTIMGYTREEMEEKVAQIIEFADIGDFINQLRISRAAAQLESAIETSDVAEDLGLSEFYFSRWFRRMTGVTPTEYRDSLRSAFTKH